MRVHQRITALLGAAVILAAGLTAAAVPVQTQAATAVTSVWQKNGNDYYFINSAGGVLQNTVTPEGVFVGADGKARDYEVLTGYDEKGAHNLGAFDTPYLYSTWEPYFKSVDEAKKAYFNTSVSKTQFENLYKDFQNRTLFLQSSYNYLDDKATLNAIQQALPVVDQYNFAPALSSTDAQVRLQAYVAEMERQAYVNYLVEAIRYQTAGNTAAAVTYRSLLSNALSHAKAVEAAGEQAFKQAGSPFYGYAAG